MLVILLPAPISIRSERIIAQDAFDSPSMPKPDKWVRPQFDTAGEFVVRFVTAQRPEKRAVTNRTYERVNLNSPAVSNLGQSQMCVLGAYPKWGTPFQRAKNSPLFWDAPR